MRQSILQVILFIFLKKEFLNLGYNTRRID